MPNINIIIPNELHKNLKIISIEKGITMKELIQKTLELEIKNG